MTAAERQRRLHDLVVDRTAAGQEREDAMLSIAEAERCRPGTVAAAYWRVEREDGHRHSGPFAPVVSFRSVPTRPATPDDVQVAAERALGPRHRAELAGADSATRELIRREIVSTHSAGGGPPPTVAYAVTPRGVLLGYPDQDVVLVPWGRVFRAATEPEQLAMAVSS